MLLHLEAHFDLVSEVRKVDYGSIVGFSAPLRDDKGAPNLL